MCRLATQKPMTTSRRWCIFLQWRLRNIIPMPSTLPTSCYMLRKQREVLGRPSNLLLYLWLTLCVHRHVNGHFLGEPTLTFDSGLPLVWLFLMLFNCHTPSMHHWYFMYAKDSVFSGLDWQRYPPRVINPAPLGSIRSAPGHWPGGGMVWFLWRCFQSAYLPYVSK